MRIEGEGVEQHTLADEVSDTGTSIPITAGDIKASQNITDWDVTAEETDASEQIPIDDSEGVNERALAMSARITELSLDDVIRYRADELFPTNSERRETLYTIYGDTNFHRAMRIISRNHNGIPKSSVRFVAFTVGLMRIDERYSKDFTDIERMRIQIDGNQAASDGLSMLPEMSVDQQSKIKQVKTGFTKANAEWVEDIADHFGITISSMLLFAFWNAAVSCPAIPIDLIEYGTKICRQFESKIAMRKAMLTALAASTV